MGIERTSATATRISLSQLVLIVVCGARVAAAPPASAASPKPKPMVTVSASAETELVRAGDVVRLDVDIEVADGWHINSNEPELKYLIATELVLADTDGAELVAVSYPKPIVRKLGFSKKALSVFDGEFAIEASVRFTADAEPGLTPIEGWIKYQACNDKVCKRPDKAAFTVPLMRAD